MIQFLLLFPILMNVDGRCNFQSFEDSQLDSNDFYGEQTFTIGNQYAFGFWIMAAPMRKNYHLSYTRPYFEEFLRNDGYHLFNFQVNNKIQTIVLLEPGYIQDWSGLIQIIDFVVLTDYGLQLYQFPFDFSKFEGSWMFLYCTYFNNIYYEFASYNTADQIFQTTNPINYPFQRESQNAKLEFGGQGQYYFGEGEANLQIFPGRISKPIIFDDAYFFYWWSQYDFLWYLGNQNCYMPTSCPKQNTLVILDSVYEARNITINQFYAEILGDIDSLEFWIKRRGKKIELSIMEFMFSFGSNANGTFDRIRMAGNLYQDSYIITNRFDGYNIYPSERSSYFVDLQFPDYEIKYWCYFKYIFIKIPAGEIVQMQIYSTKDATFYQQKVFQVENVNYFSNFIGVLTIFSDKNALEPVNKMPFSGYIANFKISYCVPSLETIWLDYDINCHNLCKTCIGPTQWDCKTCHSEQNRLLLQEINACICLYNYQEIDGQSICQKKINSVTSISQEKSTSRIQCQYGYFQILKDSGVVNCIPCPYVNKIQCINCLLNSELWSENPICDLEYQTEDGKYYSLIKINPYQFYIINKNLQTVEICQGCNSINSCFQNRFQENEKCISCALNCAQCDRQLCVECDVGYYLENGQCFACPSNCISCQINLQEVKCLSCFPQYTLIIDECQKCGINCEKCELRTINNESYLKCLWCQPNTYPSLDGVSCFYNTLANCVFPFQFSNVNFNLNINTIFYDFQPQLIETIQTGCLLCESYAYLDLDWNHFQCISRDADTYLASCYFQIKQNGYVFCKLGPILLNQYGYCYHEFPYCQFCADLKESIVKYCLFCEKGYYNDYYTSFCIPCPDQCLDCYQSDSSKMKKYLTLLSINQWLNLSYLQFRDVTQDLESSNVKIFCTECQVGYHYYDNQCRINCPSNCYECKYVNNLPVCISCLELDEYSRLTILNGECTPCPTNCKLCNTRTAEEKAQLNPYFENVQFALFSNQCLVPFDTSLYYDQQVKQFVKCQECEKYVDINIDVHCNSNFVADKFNIKIENVFSNSPLNYLNQIETNEYYLYLNTEYVKYVNYKLTLTPNSICTLTENSYFASTLQHNVFNIIKINLVFEGNNSTLIVNGNLTLSNFSSIKISNLKFETGAIITENIQGYSIQLENIVVTGQTDQKQTSFQLNKATSIIFQRIKAFNKKYQATSLIEINSLESIVTLECTNIIIIDSDFNDTSIFSLKASQSKAFFSNIQISKSVILKTLFIKGLSEADFENIFIQDCQINNSNNFFLLSNATIFNFLSFTDSQLQNSNLIEAKTGVNINNSIFSNLQIKGNSTILSFTTLGADSVFIVQKTNFIDIIYQERQAIMLVQQVGTFSITVIISHLNLINISLEQTMMQYNYQPSIKQSIFYIDCSKILIENINFIRGLGYPEFSILNALNLTFDNSNISLDDQYQFKSIYPNSNCTTREKNTFYLKTFMYLNNVIETKLNKINIQNIILYDSVFIDYKQTVQLNKTLILIVGCKFLSNVIHQTQTDSGVSLVQIESQTQSSVYIDNDLFQKNLLYISVSESSTNEGLLFSVISSSCKISNGIFQSNMIINGQSSIFQIDSKELIIEGNTFQSNSIFVYETLKQFLVWGFENTIFQEDLELLFPAKSFGGNGNLKASQLSITNTQLEKSLSKAGGAFAINLLENGKLYVFNSTFKNLSVDMSDNSLGGCFYITSNSEVLAIEIIQSTFEFIRARESGGFLYLQTSTFDPQIQVIESIFNNIYAIQGSLVYISQTQSGNPSMQMQQCQIQNQEQHFQTFINNIEQITNLELTILIQYFSLIYQTDGLIVIQNLTITEYPLLQFLYTQNSVHLSNVQFIGIPFTRPLLTFNSNVKKMIIKIDQLTIQNCTIPDSFTVDSFSGLSGERIKASCNSHQLPDTITLAGYSQGNQNYLMLVQMLKVQFIQGVISFNNFKDSDIISIKSLSLSVNCYNCQFGVLSFLNIQQTKTKISDLIISNSKCGSLGCLHINSESSRLLQAEFSTRNSIQIKNLVCFNNVAEYGGCIYLKNSQISIIESQIMYNSAIQGGAIYIKGGNSILDAKQLQIINNNATEGSGVFSTEEYLSQINGVSFFDNIGQTISTKPSQLLIQFFSDEIITPVVTLRDQYHVQSQILSKNGTEATIYLPTGIEIEKYRRFSLKSNSYSSDYQILKLYSLTDTLETIELPGTYCNCWVIDRNGVNYSNLTNKNTFYFKKEYYDLGDLILYIPQDTSKEYWLQFWCNSIFSPVIEDESIISFHQNYTLKVRVKPYKCQLGEYHISEEDYCHQCQIDLKQYSTTINATECQTQNEVMVSDITSAQVKLNQGFWRYSITSSTFDVCFNNQKNCIGGWYYGNDLCLPGYIGALCEQCDAFDIRGQGSYYSTKQFECEPCKNSYFASGVSVIGSTIVFFFFLLFFSQLQQSGQMMTASLQFTKLKQMQLKESIHLQQIKQIVQYFQIVSLSGELYLLYNTGLQIFIDFIGNAFQMSIFNFCYLSGSDFEIVYFDILQNTVILFSILSFILILLIAFHFLGLVKLSKQRILDYAYLTYIFYGCSIIRCVLKLVSFRKIQDLLWIYQNVAYGYVTSFHLKFVFGFLVPFLSFCGLITAYQFLNEGKRKKQNVVKFGIWYQAFRDCQQESLKLITLILINICIIVVDGDYSLRCLMAFTVLTLYYQRAYYKSPYCSNQQNFTEIRFILFSISIMVLNIFHRVVTITTIQDIITTFSYVLVIFSFLFIIQGLLKSQIIPIDKVMSLLIRQLIIWFPSLLNINFCYKYSEQAEQEKSRRFQLLKNYLLTASRQSLELREK